MIHNPPLPVEQKLLDATLAYVAASQALQNQPVLDLVRRCQKAHRRMVRLAEQYAACLRRERREGERLRAFRPGGAR